MSGESLFILRYPEALALAVPALAAWWALSRRTRSRWWRLAVVVLLVLAAAGPEIEWRFRGSDVVLVVDRSASVGGDRDAQQELVALIGDQRADGDRLGVVAFGRGARVVTPPTVEGVPLLSDHYVDDSASELAKALEYAASLFPAEGSGRIIVHSDGELTGLAPRRIASTLGLGGVPVDVLPVSRPPRPDAAVGQIEVPASLRRGESFIGAIRFVADSASERAWKLVRLDPDRPDVRVLIAEGKVAVKPGTTTTRVFADRPPAPGVSRYIVELDAEGDRVPENNRAEAALRVEGGERVLVMGGDGSEGNLARALKAAGLAVDSRPEGPLTLDALLGYRALVLEQVPAGQLGITSMTTIARWVEHFGGGLVMTGGRRGFGSGGYHRSPIEPVMPVTMELRDEHRKLALALAVTLDRSGSMDATVAGGQTKMALANAGTIAAIELLSPVDYVAVHAVDSAPHVVIPLSPVEDSAALAGKVRGIRAGGGGIYVYEALRAAGVEVLKAKTGTRHIVMFADAADAEVPGDYVALLTDYTDAGISVSVIGLGSDTDSDAELLRDIAQKGKGRAWFADRAEDLPRVFAQETVLVARSAWVANPTALQPQPTLATVLGPLPALAATWPQVPGYNVTYARPRADVLALAPGDPTAPGIATWRVGTGRSVALPISVDGEGAGDLLTWPGYGSLVGGLVRWAAGASETGPGTLRAERRGREVTLTLELDPDRRESWPLVTPRVQLVRDGDLAEPEQIALAAVDDGVFEATVTLSDARPLVPVVAVGPPGRELPIAGPAVQLPYSPEAEPRFGQPPGATALAAIARDSGGAVRADVSGVFDNPPRPGQLQPLAGLLAALALLFLVAEVAVRRMHLAMPSLRRLRLPRPRRRDEAATAGEATEGGQLLASEDDPAADPGQPAAPVAAPPTAQTDGIGAALAELKRRRNR